MKYNCDVPDKQTVQISNVINYFKPEILKCTFGKSSPAGCHLSGWHLGSVSSNRRRTSPSWFGETSILFRDFPDSHVWLVKGASPRWTPHDPIESPSVRTKNPLIRPWNPLQSPISGTTLAPVTEKKSTYLGKDRSRPGRHVAKHGAYKILAQCACYRFHCSTDFSRSEIEENLGGS